MQNQADNNSDRDRSRIISAPVPKELAIAAVALVVVMLMTSVALWFVAGAIDQERGQSNGAVVAVPTQVLLQTLADDLGPQSSPDDLQEAVATWLNTQSETEIHIQLASAVRGT